MAKSQSKSEDVQVVAFSEAQVQEVAAKAALLAEAGRTLVPLIRQGDREALRTAGTLYAAYASAEGDAKSAESRLERATTALERAKVAHGEAREAAAEARQRLQIAQTFVSGVLQAAARAGIPQGDAASALGVPKSRATYAYRAERVRQAAATHKVSGITAEDRNALARLKGPEFTAALATIADGKVPALVVERQQQRQAASAERAERQQQRDAQAQGVWVDALPDVVALNKRLTASVKSGKVVTAADARALAEIAGTLAALATMVGDYSSRNTEVTQTA